MRARVAMRATVALSNVMISKSFAAKAVASGYHRP
jgi:hypothetical protein